MIKLTQNSWLGGQLDAEMSGRQDVAKYRIGASELRNFLPIRRGSIRKRPGTNHVWDITDYVGRTGGELNAFRMIPFRFTTTTGYALVICAGKARIYGMDGSFYRDVQGALPYLNDELGDIVYVQCGDVMYLAHPSHPPAEIDHGRIVTTTRTVFGNWGLSAGNYWQPEVPEEPVSPEDPGRGDAVESGEEPVVRRGRVEYGTPVYSLAGGKWRVEYTSKTYPNPDPTPGEVSTDYTVVYTTENGDTSATDLAFTGYTVNGGEVRTTAAAAHRVKTTSSVTTVEDADQFFYREMPNYPRVVAPTVVSASVSRNAVKSNYRGAAKEERYAASIVALVDGTVYESAIHELTPYGDANAETGENVPVTWDGTRYYAPWTESQTINVTVRLNGGTAGQTVKAVRLYKHNGATYGLVAEKAGTWVLGANQTTDVGFTDDFITPDVSSTPLEDKSVFFGPNEYPGCVAMYQQRLVWASSNNGPSRVWMSASGDFHEHRPHAAILLTDPIDFVMPLIDGTSINFILELGRLFAFTDASEYVIGSDSEASGVNYETIMTTRQSGLGSDRRLPPIIVNNSLLFCERSRKTVRDFDFDIQKNLYGGTDVSVFSSGIFDEKRIVDWSYQQNPESTVWCVLSDGTLAALTYMKDQQVCAWSVHELGGAGKAKAVAKTWALVGNDGSNTSTSEMAVAVERNGRLAIESMRPWCCQNDTPANSVTMDGIRPGDLTGQGMTYVAEADVSGYPFSCAMTTMQPVIGNAVGNSQFDVKNIHSVHLRLRGSVGGRVRAANVPDSCAASLVKTPLPPVVSGRFAFALADEDVVLSGDNNRDGRITVEQDEPWPFQILLLEIDAEAEEGDMRQ